MKFLDNHRKDINNLIEKSDLIQADFSYIKRKGRITVVHQASENYFAYLRKKETAINEVTHQWEEKSYFKVHQNNGKEYVLNNWKAVLLDFSIWLKNIN